MKLFLDTVLTHEVEMAVKFGFIEGVTTTPTFMKRHGITDVDKEIQKISGLVKEVHVEALGDSPEEIIDEAKKLSEIEGIKNSLIFKIPISNKGLSATHQLVRMGLKVNVHLIYTLNQAYMAAMAGASYVCPLVGRLSDQGHDSMSLIKQISEMIETYQFDTKVMVSSVRMPEHVRLAIINKAHVITVPWKVMKILSHNNFTSKGIDEFTIDSKLTTYTVEQFMSDNHVTLSKNITVEEAINILTKNNTKVISVVGESGKLVGIFSDGDLKRALKRYGRSAFDISLNEVMNSDPLKIHDSASLAQAVEMIKKFKVSGLVVIDLDEKPKGIIFSTSLVNEGLIS